MKKSTLLLLCILFYFISADAQGWQWAKHTVSVSPGHAPYYTSSEPSFITTDKFGNVFNAWGNVPDFPGLTGTVTNFGSYTVTDSSDARQCFLTKNNASGNFMWTVGSQHSEAYIEGVATDVSGNSYVLGVYDSTDFSFGNYPLSHVPFTSYDFMYFMAKITESGTVLWAKNICPTIIFGHGLIQVDNAGNIYVAGDFTGSTVTIGTTTLVNAGGIGVQSDLFIAQFDSSGNSVWAERFGGTGTEHWAGFVASGGGDLYLSGSYLDETTLLFGTHTLSGPNDSGSFIVKINNSGTPEWVTGPDKYVSLWPNSLVADSSFNIYITGGFESTTVAFGGFTLTNTMYGYDDFFLVKYDSSGACQWARSAGGDLNETGYNLALDKCGNLWVTGGGFVPSATAGYPMNFDGDTVRIPSGSTPSDLLFIAHYETTGSFVNCLFFPGGGEDACGIAVDNFGSFYLGGDWDNQFFTVGSDTFISDASPQFSGEYFFTSKYFYDTSGCLPSIGTLDNHQIPISAANCINLFPNPASIECTIHSDEQFLPGSKADLFDISGRLIKTFSLTGTNTEISVANLPPGIYQCKIYVPGNDPITKKLAIIK